MTPVDQARARDIADVAPYGLKRAKYQLYGPCPHCGGRDRFWIDTLKQRFGCRGCGEGGDVIDLVMFLDGCDFRSAVKILTGDELPAHAVPPPAQPAHGTNAAPFLWSIRQPLTGTVGARYLREARGITCPLPPTLGFLPSYGEQPPRLVAAVAFAREIEPGILAAPHKVECIHRTFLRADGRGKADIEKPKRLLGPPGDKPIVIAPPNDLLGMAITEGIEDALSVHEATGLGVWAAGDAGRMPKVTARIPDWVECVTIHAHDDDAGQRGALQAAEILHGRGIEVRIEGLEP
jgi:phage/plasmid primase-like uncharacterized protein